MAYTRCVTIGERIRNFRCLLRLNQEELSQKVGVAQSHISALENSDGQTMHVRTLLRVAKALGVPPAALLEQKDYQLAVEHLTVLETVP